MPASLVLPDDFSERVGSVSPASAGFGRGAGRATLPVYYNSLVLSNAIRDLLGHVQRTPGSGRLNRTLPAAHPNFPWLMCSRVATIRGKGQYEKKPAAPVVEGTQVAYFARYELYELDAEFEHLPYACLPDGAVGLYDLSWVDESNVTINTKYANEFIRFTSYEVVPSLQYVTAQFGQQKFRTQGGAPNGVTFPGAPRVALGGRTIKLTWHFVPYSLMEDSRSPLVKYLGRINQTTFSIGSRDYPPGSLLYESLAATRYLPPSPDYFVQRGGATALSHDYVADFTLTLQHCDRSPGGTSPVPTNGNYIASGGWNLRPWVQDGRFYYVTSTDGTAADTDQTKWRPSYLSVPFQLLFSDPDQT